MIEAEISHGELLSSPALYPIIHGKKEKRVIRLQEENKTYKP